MRRGHRRRFLSMTRLRPWRPRRGPPHDSGAGPKRAVMETPTFEVEVRGALLCCLFTPRLGNANVYHSCRRVQSDVPLLEPWKALRRQGLALAGSVPGLDVYASGMAGNVPVTSVAVGGRELLDAPTLPPPIPTPSARAALSKSEVEKSV
jgi:hypothetical protein